ncbi:MAG: hypothetical protein AAFS10_13635 [Myxococcota bacterium]
MTPFTPRPPCPRLLLRVGTHIALVVLLLLLLGTTACTGTIEGESANYGDGAGDEPTGMTSGGGSTTTAGSTGGGPSSTPVDEEDTGTGGDEDTGVAVGEDTSSTRDTGTLEDTATIEDTAMSPEDEPPPATPPGEPIDRQNAGEIHSCNVENVVPPRSAVRRVKYLLTGMAVTEAELQAVNDNPNALRGLVREWVDTGALWTRCPTFSRPPFSNPITAPTRRATAGIRPWCSVA